MKKTVSLILLALVLWTVMFSPWTGPYINFWLMMSFSALTLTTLSTIYNRGWWSGMRLSVDNILLGAVIAVALWGVFWVGDKVSQWMFDFARPEVNLIYGMKDGTNAWLLSALLLFLIGPAEEIFWRRYVQESLSRRYNANVGFVITTAIYALVHVGSFNFMLTMAALVCGVAWGGLYRLFPDRFAAILISHALWDAAVFVWFPI